MRVSVRVSRDEALLGRVFGATGGGGTTGLSTMMERSTFLALRVRLKRGIRPALGREDVLSERASGRAHDGDEGERLTAGGGRLM